MNVILQTAGQDAPPTKIAGQDAPPTKIAGQVREDPVTGDVPPTNSGA